MKTYSNGIQKLQLSVSIVSNFFVKNIRVNPLLVLLVLRGSSTLNLSTFFHQYRAVKVHFSEGFAPSGTLFHAYLKRKQGIVSHPTHSSNGQMKRKAKHFGTADSSTNACLHRSYEANDFHDYVFLIYWYKDIINSKHYIEVTRAMTKLWTIKCYMLAYLHGTKTAILKKWGPGYRGGPTNFFFF